MSRISDALKRATAEGDNRAVFPAAAGVPAVVDTEPPWVLEGASAADAEIETRLDEPRIHSWTSDEPPRDAGPVPAPDADRPMALFQGFAAEVVEKLVVTPTIDQTSLEQYRRLAATLHLSQGSRRLKVVMIASALPYEGKTLTASNLALTLSESYRRRVLLVDADLRRPTLHEMFGLPNGPGLNDMLHATDDEKVPVIQVSPFLYVLTGGRPDADPMSMLTSDRMRRVLQEAAAKFDWVILDTPPVGLMTDAGLLAAMADAVALVVHAARTACPSIQRAIEAVGRQRVLGIVLNRVDKRVLRDAYRLGEYTSRYAQPNGIPA